MYIHKTEVILLILVSVSCRLTPSNDQLPVGYERIIICDVQHMANNLKNNKLLE